MQFFLHSLQDAVSQRRLGEYPGIYPETRSILYYAAQKNFLRKPQTEALETYIYLKEIHQNKTLVDVYLSLIEPKELRKQLFTLEEREDMEDMDKDQKDVLVKQKLIEQMGSDDYSNQVYALTMGTGKTVLMTVLMLYDIVLSYHYPQNPIFAKNFLVFAPDKTIIQSLKEIKDFDYTNVIPPEFYNALLQIKYHYLEDTKQKIGVSEGSNYNIIITNSQKIIVKTRQGNANDFKKTIFGDEREREQHQIENQRLMALKRLDNLSIFVDEAHHSFGTNLEGDLKKTKETINRLHQNKTLVNCINMTGTPYIDGEMIPTVVCYYGLKQGIEDGILKEVNIIEFGEVKDDEFLSLVIENFWHEYGSHIVEQKTAKIAIYTSGIAELREVRKKLETDILKRLHIPTNIIVENHQEATKEDEKEFFALDTPDSSKKIVLLVNKGTEGRNCKSLFATALYRKPPAIFTLQSTTRCLRAIGDNSKKATIFLSKENYKMLDKELQQNFGVSINDVQKSDKKTQPITCKVEKRKEIRVQKIIKEIVASKVSDYKNIQIDFANYKGKEVYVHLKTIEKQDEGVVYKEGLKDSQAIQRDIINRAMSRYEILGYIYHRTHLSFDGIKSIFNHNNLASEAIVEKVSTDNGLLDFIIDQICRAYYQYEEKEVRSIEILQLIKKDIAFFTFEVDGDKINRNPKLVVYKEDMGGGRLGFHLNPYNFDSTDEMELFGYIRSKLNDDEHIEDVYFTGSNTEKQSDFFFEYSIFEDGYHKIKRYFPDILVDVKKADGTSKYVVIEVKGGDEKSDYEQAKMLYDKGETNITNMVFAKEMGFQEFAQHNKEFEYKLTFDAKVPSTQREVLEKIVAFE